MREAIPSLRRAFDHYIQAGDIAQAIAVVEYPAPSQSELFFELAQLLSRALTLVPSDSHAAGRLLSAYGRCISFRGDYQATQQAFQRALAIARRERDMALEVRTLAFAARGDSRYLRYGECVEKSLRAIELARSVDEPRIELQAGVWGAESLMALGELEQARRLTETSLALAERLRRRYELVIALRTQMTLSRLEGDWPAARESGQRGLAVSPNDATLLSQLALLEYQLGNFGQGEAYLDQWLELAGLTSPGHPSASFALPAVVIPVVARIAGTAGRTGMAQETAKAVLTAPSVDLFTAVIARAGLALLAAQRSDGEAAREQYTTLEPQRGTILEVADVAFDRLLGLLAQTTGNLDKAAQHFEDALAFCRKAGYRPELAWTCCDYADTLLARNQPGDRQKAISLLDECLRITRELGMRPLLERALSRREILKA
jgi:tetratricopeptide (TPR) repeat protein